MGSAGLSLRLMATGYDRSQQGGLLPSPHLNSLARQVLLRLTVTGACAGLAERHQWHRPLDSSGAGLQLSGIHWVLFSRRQGLRATPHPHRRAGLDPARLPGDTVVCGCGRTTVRGSAGGWTPNSTVLQLLTVYSQD